MAIRFSEFSNKLLNSTHRHISRVLCDQIAPSAAREQFFSTDAFSIGKIVEHNKNSWEIVDKRSNYVVLCNEQGELKKMFPDVLTPSEKQMRYKEGTYKGIPIPPTMVGLVESADTKDPVAIIKCIQAYSTKDYETLFSVAKTLGADMTNLEESTKQEQMQAALIVASAIGCKTTAKNAEGVLADIKKKAEKTKMSTDQKKIYSDMLGMLKKLGMNVDVEITEEVDPPQEKIGFAELKNKIGNKQKLVTKPGHLLGASNETHRHQLVRKLQGLD